MNQKISLPNSTAVLVLGICSIVFGCFFIGLPLGIIGMVMASKGMKMHKENPTLYEGYGSLNPGYIMSIIGTALSGLYVIYWILCVAIFGAAAMSMWDILNP